MIPFQQGHDPLGGADIARTKVSDLGSPVSPSKTNSADHRGGLAWLLHGREEIWPASRSSA